MVVEPGQDLDVGAGPAVGAGEPVVGEIGLPGLVGLFGLEANVGALGSFGRLRGEQILSGQVPSDRGRETVMWWVCCRCQRIVSGPASKPRSISLLRTVTISSTTLGSTAIGE